MAEPLLVIACGALAREIHWLRKARGWEHLHLKCIDARLHNRPARIPAELRRRIRRYRDQYRHIYVAYADCGTGGAIDRVLAEEGVERLPGAHCYQFFAGQSEFERLSEEEPGTFYLTDFLARNFERLVVQPLKLDRYPQLMSEYFGNYRRLVYLSQKATPELDEAARRAASYLGLEYQHVACGYGSLETGIEFALQRRDRHEENVRLLA